MPGPEYRIYRMHREGAEWLDADERVTRWGLAQRLAEWAGLDGSYAGFIPADNTGMGGPMVYAVRADGSWRWAYLEGVSEGDGLAEIIEGIAAGAVTSKTYGR